MSFAEPSHLLALLGIPLVGLLWALNHRRRSRFAVRHPGVAALAAAVPRAPRWRSIVPIVLLGGGVVATAAAFAKPQHTVHVPIEKASVELVSDESGSMMADDVEPTRIQAAQAAARSFIKAAPDGLLVGFASFASGVNQNISPSAERGPVKSAIDQLQAEGGTATGDALNTALDQLATRKGRDGRTAPAAIVLLSDGATTDGSDPLAAADRAKRLRIPIYTVALGTDGGTVQTPDGRLVPVPPDRETLREIAQRSGGRAYEANDADTLDGVYRDLGSKIGTHAEQREITVGFVAAGLVLLLGGLGTGVRFRGVLA